MAAKDYYRVIKYIEKLAQNPYLESFYADAISRALIMPVDLVVVELDKLVHEEFLIQKYEIRRIPELDIVATVDDYQELIDTEVECEDGVEIITYANIFPIYYISEEYREIVKNENDKKNLCP